ncbi:MAG: hypothetical protein MK102_09345 [Fuerstiella sp.]|nr:hypothetical protein [Fuerstiella sp.]
MNIKLCCLALASTSWLTLLTCTTTYAQSETNTILYDRLASETTADALALTTDQQESIASIIAERNIALTSAEDDEAKARITAEAQTKLEALLTEEQQTKLAALIEKPRIRFNFRFQKWAEVLHWVAGEAGLSLAMEEPPEGTFNYSDRREYEPDEAIDFLNGWLMIKGFTLVRRDQQLMCISLNDGIPAGTVPRIPLEDLPKRGRFEFVSVLIPLDNRDAGLVMTEIKPLVSEWGEVKAMAATKQLLVTDSAEIVRNIQQVAMDVPAPRPAPGGGPKPVLTTYPVQHPNPAAVVDVLKNFVGGTILLDETASQITINAVPEQHARAVTIMKQLEENQGPDKRPELKSYPVRANNAAQMLRTLRLAVPSATLQYDSTASRLVVFANSQDHQKLTAAMLELETQAVGGETQLSVHPLKDIDSEVVQKLITSVLPDVRVTVDQRTSTLIAVGRLAELRAVQTLVDQLQPESVNINSPVLRPYPVPTELSAMTNTVIHSVVPNATVTPDPANERLLIVAQPKDHETIAATLEKLALDVATDGMTLRTYSLPEQVNNETFTSMLKAVAKKATVRTDAVNKRLLITASAEEHAAAQRLLEQLTTDLPDSEKRLQSYAMPNETSPDTVTSMLKTLAPEASVVIDAANERILVTATDNMQQTIAATLKKLALDAATDSLTLRTYSLPEQVDNETFTSMLQAVAKKATIRTDAVNKRLLITASAEEHAAAQRLLEQLTTDLPDSEKRLQSYAMPNETSPDTVTSMLKTLAPEASVVIDVANERILVTATENMQQTVAGVLDQLTTGTSSRRPKLKTFPLPDNVTAETVKSLLTPVAPEATVIMDTARQRVFVTATQQDHDVIGPMLSQLTGDQNFNEHQLKSHPLRADVDPATVTTLLKNLTPNAVVTTDTTGHRLLVTATIRDHELIGSAITQITQDARGELAQLQFYPLERVNGDYAVNVLGAIVPGITVTHERETQRLSVVASQVDHEIIRQTLFKLESAAPEKENRELRVYGVTNSQRARFNTVLQGLSDEIPGIQILSGGEPDEMIIWAKAAHHEIVDSVLAQLDRDIPADQKPSLVVYPINSVEAESVAEVLREIFPDASIKVDSRASRLLIRARPQTQVTIKSAIQQLDSKTSEGREIRLMVYPVKGINADTVLSLIKDEVPRVTVIRDQAAETFIVRGQLEEHQKVAALLDTLRSSNVGKQVPIVYSSFHSDPERLRLFFERVYPESTVIVDRNAHTLTVHATTEDHVQIKKTIDELSRADADRENRLDLKFYNVNRDQISTAQDLLNSTAPDLQVKVSNDGTQLIALVTEEQDAKITATLDQLATAAAGAPRKTTAIYDISGTDPEAIRRALAPFTSTDDSVRITVDATSKRLYIHAFEDHHEDIRTAVTQIMSAIKDGAQTQVAIYFVGDGNADETREILSALYPDTKIMADRRRRMIIVTAAPEQHERIKAVAEQIRNAVEDGTGVIPKTYATTHLDGNYLESVVRDLFPEDRDFVLNVNPANGQMVALARPDQHETIRKLLIQIDVEPNAAAKTVRVFRTAPLTPATVIAALEPLVSKQTTMSIEPTGDEIVVSAPADEQLKIVELLRQMEVSPDDVEKSLAVYRVAPLDARTVISALEPLVSGHVTMSRDRRGQEIIISAPAQEQSKIATLVQQIRSRRSESEGVGVRSYRLGRGQARDVISVLKPMFPDVKLVTDRRAETLIATALPEEHETIAEVVKQMTGQGDETKQPVAKSYLMRQYDGNQLAELLQTTFTASDEVRINWDDRNKRIVAVARPDQHETIKSIIDELDPQDGPYSRHLEFYPVPNLDLETVNQVVDGAIRHVDPAARIASDHGSETLMVTTHERGHQLVKDTINRFTPNEPQRLKIFQLSFISPEEAYNAIDRMISHRIHDDYHKPDIHPDDNLQQLWIRATDKQLKEIEELLAQLGEAGVASNGTGGSDVNLRIVPVGNDVEGAIQRIENLWPRIRNNPIRILNPNRKPLQEQESAPGQFSVPPEDFSVGGTSESSSTGQPNTGESDFDEADRAKDSGNLADASNFNNSKNVASTDKNTKEHQKLDGTDPVILIPGDRRITLASDDTEALNQLESLLRAIGAQGAGDTSNRDFSIMRLKNTAAADVSAIIQQIRDETKGITYFGDIAVVPQERLNALIVYGNRTDRRRLEPLLEVLDSEHRDSTRTYQTRLLSLKYANAARIENILQSLYKTQMIAGGRRASMGIPSGVPPEIATVLRQINAAASAPLLIIETQTETNSLIIKAPADLLAEVTEFAKDLDEAALSRRVNGVTLLTLEKSSSKRVMEILSRVLK